MFHHGRVDKESHKNLHFKNTFFKCCKNTVFEVLGKQTTGRESLPWVSDVISHDS
jgi:hypothetical protein